MVKASGCFPSGCFHFGKPPFTTRGIHTAQFQLKTRKDGVLINTSHSSALVCESQKRAAEVRLTLLCACIAHNNTILTEHTTSASSQTSSLASLVLPKIVHTTAQKLTYTHNNNFIHYIADAPSEYAPESSSAGGLTYLVVADSSLGRRIPFGFLFEIKKRFLAQYPPESTDFATLPNYGAGSFNTELKKLMVDYGTTKAGQQDAISNVQGEIDNVRGIMSQNIESLLERGERIDLLVDKTDRLGGSAHDFRVRSRTLRRQMWFKNIKLMALLVLVIIFLVYLFVGFGCGLPGWSKCIGKGK
jgi:vesicle-associated membrane protein 7